MAYSIRLAECQRQIIAIALRNLSFEAINEIKQLDIPYFENDQLTAVGHLRTMVDELPEIEACHPGVIHGFAL